MKHIVIICIAFMAAAAVIKPHPALTSIYGNIEPAEAAKKVFAIKGTDTLVVIPEAGKFSIAVSAAGSWKIYVQAMPPYKDASVNSVIVEEGKSSDVGTIRLVSSH